MKTKIFLFLLPLLLLLAPLTAAGADNPEEVMT